jgi:hypothetical protein
MRYVKGHYVADVQIQHPVTGANVTLHVWMNPETKQLMALDNMEVDVHRNYAHDPYQPDVGIVFEDTFTGLPK